MEQALKFVIVLFFLKKFFLLCYSFDIGVSQTLENGRNGVLVVESKGHGVHAFLNQDYIGNFYLFEVCASHFIITIIMTIFYDPDVVSAYGNGQSSSFTIEAPIHLKSGTNQLAFLSVAVGLQVSFHLFFFFFCLTFQL